ncbi:MAG: hypothetical protein K5757_07880 [Bacteroidaceae bacterium]|nr:hypothetical protein [Bacteroidaceae bacterium]
MIKIKHLLFIFVSVIVASCQSSLDNLAEEYNNSLENTSSVRFMKKEDFFNDYKKKTRLSEQNDVDEEPPIGITFIIARKKRGCKDGNGICVYSPLVYNEEESIDCDSESDVENGIKEFSDLYAAELKTDSNGVYMDFLAVGIDDSRDLKVSKFCVDEDAYCDVDCAELVDSIRLDHLYVPKGKYKFDKNIGTCGGYRIQMGKVMPSGK